MTCAQIDDVIVGFLHESGFDYSDTFTLNHNQLHDLAHWLLRKNNELSDNNTIDDYLTHLVNKTFTILQDHPEIINLTTSVTDALKAAEKNQTELISLTILVPRVGLRYLSFLFGLLYYVEAEISKDQAAQPFNRD